MPILIANNAESTLAAALAVGGTSLTVTTGHGSRFPTLTGTGVDYLLLTLVNANTGAKEIVKCITHPSGSTTLSGLTRAQESTTAAAFSVGDIVAIRLTKGVLDGETAQAPTYANSWVNFGGASLAGGYWKDVCGVVHIQGSIKSGAFAAAAFTLAAGYRPSATVKFPLPVMVGAGANVTIDSAGVVTINGTTNTEVPLDGINFRAA